MWTVDDARRCLAVSGCDALMLGRGTDPGLALAVRDQAAPGWDRLQPLLRVYWTRIALHVEPRHRPGRLKQWLNLLRRRFAEAEAAYVELRMLTQQAEVEAWLLRADTARTQVQSITAGEVLTQLAVCID